MPNKELKDLCIKTELWHEIGHLFNASNRKRPNLVDKLGFHDPEEEICVMRQGKEVPQGWIKFAEDYKNKKIIYYDWCKKAIEEFLTKII